MAQAASSHPELVEGLACMSGATVNPHPGNTAYQPAASGMADMSGATVNPHPGNAAHQPAANGMADMSGATVNPHPGNTAHQPAASGMPDMSGATVNPHPGNAAHQPVTNGMAETGMPETPAANGAAPAGIRAIGVFASYGERQVLNGLDLDVAQGTVTALAGPNGVGKSTLLRAIAGALRPARGEIRIMGADIFAMNGKERARMVSIVPQNPELPRGASALEVTLMGRNPHLPLLAWESAADVAIAIESLRMTDAEHLIERPVQQLSGGERQRVAIAMALAQQTPVILLDEPTANLDLAHQPTIMRLLRQLAAAGKTLITAVHDLTLAGQFCDTVALISGGRVTASGPPETTLTPETIREVYGAETLVLPHPETGKPIVVSR